MCIINKIAECFNCNRAPVVEEVEVEGGNRPPSTCMKVMRVANDILTLLGAALIVAGVILSVSGTIATACSSGAGFPVLISGIAATCIGAVLTLGTKLARDHCLNGSAFLRV